VAKPSIDWVWYDRPHYLFPDDPVGEQAFAVIRDAMRETDTVAISRLVLYRRERAVMLEPRDSGVVLWTLRYGDEVRAPEPHFEGLDGAAPSAKTQELFTALIDKQTKPWSPRLASDPVQERLLQIVAAKKAKKPAAKTRAAPSGRGAEVIDIMDALRKSLGSAAGARKR